jgi:hypothetical protein
MRTYSLLWCVNKLQITPGRNLHPLSSIHTTRSRTFGMVVWTAPRLRCTRTSVAVRQGVSLNEYFNVARALLFSSVHSTPLIALHLCSFFFRTADRVCRTLRNAGDRTPLRHSRITIWRGC